MEKTPATERLPETGGSDFRLLRFIFLRNKSLLMAFAAIGLLLGFIYFRIVAPQYQVGGTLLIREESRNPELKNVFRQLQATRKTSGIEDQIGLLKSHRLNLLTLEQFNWTHRWSKSSWSGTRDLFPEEPLIIRNGGGKKQTDVPLRITVLSNHRYRIECNGTAGEGNAQHKISIDRQLRFGETFSSELFSFTLEEKPDHPPTEGDVFELVFTDNISLANRYKEALEAVRFNPLIESNLIRLKLVTENPVRDVEYLNRLMDVYLQFGIEEKNRAAENTIRFIESQISTVNKSLESAGNTFTNFKSTNRTVNLDLEASTMVGKQNDVENELDKISNNLANLKQLAAHLENEEALNAPSVSGLTDDALKSKVTKLSDLLVRRQALSLTARDQSPVLLSLDEEIRFTRKMLKENIRSLISLAENEAGNLSRRQSEIRQSIARLPSTEKDMIGMKRDFDLNNELYTFLLERRTEAEISRASAEANAQILDPAAVGTAFRLGPVLGLNLVFGLCGGLLLAIAVILIRYFASDTVEDVSEAQALLNVAPVGQIPLSGLKSTINSLRDNPRSPVAEAFRGLRMNLSHLLDHSNGRVICVHSFLPGAGKSFVAKNLAESFSLSRKKVLLIDGDLMKPVLNEQLGFTSSIGLADYFSLDTDIDRLARPTGIPGLDFISSSGKRPQHQIAPDPELAAALMKTLRPLYDVIIIDNSPYGLVSDPKVLGGLADLNLFVVRINHSQRSEIRELNRMGNLGSMKGMAVAINGLEVSRKYEYYQKRNHTLTEKALEWIKTLFREKSRQIPSGIPGA